MYPGLSTHIVHGGNFPEKYSENQWAKLFIIQESDMKAVKRAFDNCRLIQRLYSIKSAFDISLGK